MAEAEVIETTAEVVEEETLKPEDIPFADVPAYTVAGAIEWMRRPENEQAIRQFSQKAGEGLRAFAREVDRQVSETGRLVLDMCADEDVMTDVKNTFLRSLVGNRYDD